jgi:hypothetical protein
VLDAPFFLTGARRRTLLCTRALRLLGAVLTLRERPAPVRTLSRRRSFKSWLNLRAPAVRQRARVAEGVRAPRLGVFGMAAREVLTDELSPGRVGWAAPEHAEKAVVLRSAGQRLTSRRRQHAPPPASMGTGSPQDRACMTSAAYTLRGEPLACVGTARRERTLGRAREVRSLELLGARLPAASRLSARQRGPYAKRTTALRRARRAHRPRVGARRAPRPSSSCGQPCPARGVGTVWEGREDQADGGQRGRPFISAFPRADGEQRRGARSSGAVADAVFRVCREGSGLDSYVQGFVNGSSRLEA